VVGKSLHGATFTGWMGSFLEDSKRGRGGIFWPPRMKTSGKTEPRSRFLAIIPFQKGDANRAVLPELKISFMAGPRRTGPRPLAVDSKDLGGGGLS